MTILLAVALFGYNSYFCNLHSHTSYSDGTGLPSEAYSYARDSARIDVLALTDHTSYLNAGTYAQERELAIEMTEPGRFVALAGQEFGSLSAFGHFTIYDADSLCPVSVSDLTRFYQWISRLKEPVQFNHPRVGDFSDFAYDRAADAYATTLEVVNGSGMYTPVYEDMFVLALRNGWHVAPVANQDNHSRMWGNAPNDSGQIPLTGVWADTLTREAILDGLLHRRVYATEVKPANDRIVLRDFRIGSLEMGMTGVLADTVAELRVELEAESAFRQVYLYRSGVLFDSAAASSLDTNHVVWNLNVPVTNDFFFVKAEQKDHDHLWSAPIWLSYQAPPRGLEFHPNPFGVSTSVVCATDSLAVTGGDLDVFDASGLAIWHAAVPAQPAGAVRVSWDGHDLKDRLMPNGVYLVRLSLNYTGRKGADQRYGKVAIER